MQAIPFYIHDPVKEAPKPVQQKKRIEEPTRIGKLYPNPVHIKHAYKRLRMISGHGSRSKNAMMAIQIIDSRPGISQRDVIVRMRYKEQSQVSTLLDELVEYGYLIETRNGKQSHYFLNYEEFERATQAIKHLKPTKQTHAHAERMRRNSLMAALKSEHLTGVPGGLYDQGKGLYQAVNVLVYSNTPHHLREYFGHILSNLLSIKEVEEYCIFKELGRVFSKRGDTFKSGKYHYLKNFPMNLSVGEMIGAKHIRIEMPVSIAMTMYIVRLAEFNMDHGEIMDDDLIVRLGRLLCEYYFDGKEVNKREIAKLQA